MMVQRRALSVAAAHTLAFVEHRIPSVVITRLLVCLRLARAISVTVGTPHHRLAVMKAALPHVELDITRLGMSTMISDQYHPLTAYRNSRRAPCDKKLPQDLDTTGFTHLVLAFATIDPQTYKILKMHPDEEAVYHDFVTRPDGIPKYLGIGGWEFSNPGPTRRTWSQMASTKENRHAFIESLGQFLAKWQFRGVDIHWQWPGAESRGGNPSIDTQNLVALMTELRQGLGNNYGISIALPAQYEYLKAMNPKAIEPFVDWFNMLTYDLHGPWDADVPAFGNKIRSHTDLQEIDKALQLLWSSNINPSKVNLGIANYGRGYTVADRSCMHSGCPFTGASRPGECTLLAGILSRCEIQRRIKANNLTPTIISGGAGVKEVTWDDQWIGYDDDETLQLKTQLANNRCLGGTALWALSYGACKKDPFEPPIPISATVSPPASTQSPPSSGTSRVPPNGPTIQTSQSRQFSISRSLVQASSPQAPVASSSKAPTMSTSGDFAVPPLQPSTMPFTTSTQVSSSQLPTSPSKIPTISTSGNVVVPPLQPSSASSKFLTTRPILSPTVSKGSSALPSAAPSAAPESSQHPSSRTATVLPSDRSTTLASSIVPSPAPWPTPVRPSSGIPSQTFRESASTSRRPSGTGIFSVPSAASSGSVIQVTSRPASSSALSFGPSSAATSILPPLPSGSGPRSSGSISSFIQISGTPGGSFLSSPSTSSRSKSVPVPINPSRTSPFLISTDGSLQASATLPSTPPPPVTGTSKKPTTPLVPSASPPSAGTSRISETSQISSRLSSSSSAAISTSPPLRPSGTSFRAPPSSLSASTTNKISAPPQTIPTAPPSITPGPPSSVPKPTTSPSNDNSPAPTGGASKCVPQDCIKECIVQRLLSFIAVKRPICVCVPKTCHENDDNNNHHHDPDSDSDSDEEDNCSLLGCGKSCLPPLSH
jgi:GH18 family chitinase